MRRLLVLLLVAGLAAALWLWKPGASGDVRLSADTSACCARLREIYAALVRYSTASRQPLAGTGPAFLQVLVTSGTWPDGPGSRERLRCPSTGTPYAARDAVAFPLAHFPSGGVQLEPLAACDGGGGLAHADCLNVLYSDGSVQTLVLEQEIESGRLPPGTRAIPIGPDSPVPDLRKLSTR